MMTKIATGGPDIATIAPLPRRRDGVPRMRALWALESSNQLYSGIGRNLFETVRRLTDRIAWEFAIDDLDGKNVAILRRFAEEQGCPVHVGAGRTIDGQSGPINDRLPSLLRMGGWDVVGVEGWANSAAHAQVLESIGDHALCYTPHDQPTWTVPFSDAEAAHVAEVHRGVVRRADVVFCVSPAERRALQALDPGRDHCQYTPNGCNFAEFRPGPLVRRPRLLFVGDLAERRKRFDRAIGVFGLLRKTWPDLRLTVIGNRSGEAAGFLPDDLRGACDLRGYVDDSELRRAYAESAGLLLLSDFEAFGLPILEALACGTPVFLNRHPVTLNLFDGFTGAHACPADDWEATAAIVSASLGRGPGAIADVVAGRDALEATFNYDLLARRKGAALASAWVGRHHWPWKS